MAAALSDSLADKPHLKPEEATARLRVLPRFYSQ
ncbi:hypothetical protein ABID62_007404 [Bradyrhizobium sp. S3.9.1]